MRANHPLLLGALTLFFVMGARAHAQAPLPVPEPEPETKPETKPEARPAAGAEPDEEVDQDILTRSIVETAMKTKITVAEAPAVIHVLTAKDLTDFGYRSPHEALLYLPGFIESNGQFDEIPMWLTLGVIQGALYLRDGISLYDPYGNVAGTMRRSPMEIIKRVEIMSSPGGVLWGSNSFLGIVNVSTKDPEDVNKVELGIGGGDGKGDQQVIRPWILYGQTFFGGKLGVLAHYSVEWYKGPQYHTVDPWLISSPAAIPGPNSYRYPFGRDTSVPTSVFQQFDGKVRYKGKGGVQRVTFGWQLGYHKMPNLALSIRDKELKWWNGMHVPIGTWGTPMNFDSPTPAVRQSAFNLYESYAYLAYQDRWVNNRLGMDAKGYFIRFNRSMEPIVFLPYSSETVMPGASNNVIAFAHRGGGTVDMDFEVTRNFKLQWGGEMYYEWVKDANTNYLAPYDRNGQINFGLLGILRCPFYNRHGDNIPVYDSQNPENTTFVPGCVQRFVLDSDRLAYGVFAALDFKPHERLRLNGGVRLSQGIAGNLPYAPTPSYAAAAVWNIWEELYLKVNYATGFRPPVFMATYSNADGGSFDGNPNLKNETSHSIKAELNMKILKNRARIRELVLRVNYSYTLLYNMIREVGGGYINSPGRAIHAAEMFMDLNLKGDHRLILSYTYVHHHGSSDEDGGVIRSIPNHWLAASSIFNLFHIGKWRMDLNLTLRLIGPFQDPNQLMICPAGSDFCSARPSDRVYDPIQPMALLNGGLRLGTELGGKPFEVSANFYNMLDGHYWSPDHFNDLSATLEMLPVPGQRFYFYLQAKIRL